MERMQHHITLPRARYSKRKVFPYAFPRENSLNRSTDRELNACTFPVNKYFVILIEINFPPIRKP